MSQQRKFLLAGLTSGLLTVAIARASPTLFPVLLVVGVGPLFFVAVLAAIASTGSWSHLSPGGWRIVAGFFVSTGAYLIALATFLFVGGYSNVPASADPNRLGADIWIGLLAAALVASACIELLAYVLTGKWSNAFLFRLAAAGIVSVFSAFVVDLGKHNYWAFYGILLPLGEALFCWLVGAQIWRPSVQVVQLSRAD